MGPARSRALAVALTLACLLAPLAVGPTMALSPPPCEKATGITVTQSGTWVLSSRERLQAFDANWTPDWDAGLDDETYAVETGPNGSLWVLRNDEVVRLDDTRQPVERVALAAPLTDGELDPDSVDLTYDAGTGRWLVLAAGNLTSYNRSWADPDPDPPMQTVVPAEARGMTVDDNTVAFVTGNSSDVYERTAPTDFERRNRSSLSLDDTAVDVHAGPNGTWLVVQPGNVTAYDSGWERQGQRADVFAPGGCAWSGDPGTGLFFGMLVFLAVIGLGLLLVLALLVGAILYFRTD